MSKRRYEVKINCIDSQLREFTISLGETLLNFYKINPIDMSKCIYKNILQKLNNQGMLDVNDYREVLYPLIESHPYYKNCDVQECRRMIISACSFFLQKRSERLIKFLDNSRGFENVTRYINDEYAGNSASDILRYMNRQIEDFLRTIITEISDSQLETVGTQFDEISNAMNSNDFLKHDKAYRFAKALMNNVIICKERNLPFDVKELKDLVDPRVLMSDDKNTTDKLIEAKNSEEISAALSNGQMYIVPDILTSIRFEIKSIIENDIPIKKCNICNRLFHPIESRKQKSCSSYACIKAIQINYAKKQKKKQEEKQKETFEKIFFQTRSRINIRKSRTPLTETAKIELCHKILFDLKQLKKNLGNGTNSESLKEQFIEFFGKNEDDDKVKRGYKYRSDLREMEQELNEELSEYARKK